MRTGAILIKIGSTAIFQQDGRRMHVTLLFMDSCQVVTVKTLEKDGYYAVQVGASNTKKTSKPLAGHFKKAGVVPKRKLAEFRVNANALPNVGSEIYVQHFIKDQFVDVTSFSIGRGFSGVIRRHGFGGLEASHGVSVSHRSHGSTGQCQEPGRVFKGKKMAGHFGNNKVTIKGLKVIAIDEELSLLAVKGAVPGPRGGFVIVRDSKKYSLPSIATAPVG
jgi:large subunit ribosomal protein L3